MHVRLPRSLYELKPFVYIAVAALLLNRSGDSIPAQAVFVAMSSWALMILFMRRAFRLNLTELTPGFRGRDSLLS